MSIDLSLSRPAMYTTWLDVVMLLANEISTGNVDFSRQELFNRVKSISQIDNFVLSASSEVAARLASSGFSLTGTPWTTIPIPQEEGGAFPANMGDGRCIGVLAGTSADTTAVWKIIITTAGNTSAAVYSLISFVEGSQGTGLAMTADNISTNTDVTVGDNSFVDGDTAWSIDDSFYFSLNLAPSFVWNLTTTLAAAYLLNAVHNSQAPNESRYGSLLYARVQAIFKGILDGKILPSAPDLNMVINMPYYVNSYGVEVDPADVETIDVWE